MSIKLMSAAWELDLPLMEKMVLLCLCDHANDDGECWPSIERVARKCSTSDRTVQRSLNKLKERGLLVVDLGGGRKNCNRYSIKTPTQCHPDTVSPFAKNPDTRDKNPDTGAVNPDTVSPEPSRTIKETPSVLSAEADDTFTFDDFVESWNEVATECGLPILKAKTKARRTAFRVRQREFRDIDDWKAALRCVRTSKFLRGENPTGWRADPDFFLQAKSFPKLVEGSYG